MLRIEVDGAGLCVDNDPGAANLVGYLQGELQDEAEELSAEPHRLRRLVDGEAREPEHRHGVARKLLSRALWQVLNVDVARRQSSETVDAFAVHRDVRYPKVMPKLVLACVPVEEAVERLVA
jgi:hypothetical protein